MPGRDTMMDNRLTEHSANSENASLRSNGRHKDRAIARSAANAAFESVVAELRRWIQDDSVNVRDKIDADTSDDCLYVKNKDGVVVSCNRAFGELFVNGSSAQGRRSTDFLDVSMRSASKLSDALICGPAALVDFRHEGRGSDGIVYEMRTCKLSLRELQEPGWSIAGVTRRLRKLTEPSRWSVLSNNGRFEAFCNLSEGDRWICQQIALGRTGAVIASDLGLTRRAVEMRKRKVLDMLELESVAELICFLVRAQDGGYADLGL